MVEGKITMEKQAYQAFQVRLPLGVYNQVIEHRIHKPHVSLNAFVVEAVMRYLKTLKKEALE